MNYKTLSNTEKGVIAPPLKTLVGVAPDRVFTLKVNGNERFFLCKELKMNWELETVEVIFTEPTSSHPKIRWRVSRPFFEPMLTEIDVLPRAIIYTKKKEAYVPPPEPTIPRTHAELIRYIGSLEAAHFFNPKELASGGDIVHDAVLRVLAKVTGTLEVMERRRECGECSRELVRVG